MATSQFASLSEPRTSAVLLLHRRNVRIPLVLLFHANILQRIKIYTSWIYTGRPLISCEGRGGRIRRGSDRGTFFRRILDWRRYFWSVGEVCFFGTYLKKRKNFFQYVVECFFFRRWQISRIDLYGSIFFFFISLCVMYNRRMRAGRRIIFVMSSRWWIVLSNYLSIECLGKQVCYRRR